MFSFRYLVDELRRRVGRTVLTALGLALGVGFVMGIVGVANGLSSAQAKVLSPLGSVGTDIIVTRTAGATTAGASSAATTTTTTPFANGSGRGGGVFGGGGTFGRGGSFQGRPGGFFGPAAGSLAGLNASDRTALLEANSSVLTDLAKLGKPGASFTHDFFVPGTLITFPSKATQLIASTPGVSAAVSALSLEGIHESGTVPPRTVLKLKAGGETLSGIAKPKRLSAAQLKQVQSCLRKLFTSGALGSASPGFGGFGAGNGSGGTSGPTGSSSGGQRTFRSGFAKCLPSSYQRQRVNVIAPVETIERIVNPPNTNTSTQTYSVAGVDPGSPDLGLVTKAQVVSGSWFGASPADEVLVNSAYASTKGLKAGGALEIDGKTYKIVGLAAPALSGDVADLYFSLPTAQALSSSTTRVNEVLVKVDSASDVGAVAAAIHKELPGATIVTDKSLAGTVTGSLSNAGKLAHSLGLALAVIVLLLAFLVAVLLTLSSVTKRVREIGTLRAIGWTRGRVVRQLVAETVGIGLIGGVIGVLAGFAICAAVGHFGPTLTASSSGAVLGASSASGFFKGAVTASASHLVKVSALIYPTTVVLGLAVAIVGGLIAGGVGGWRAARLAPASALRDLG